MVYLLADVYEVWEGGEVEERTQWQLGAWEAAGQRGGGRILTLCLFCAS